MSQPDRDRAIIIARYLYRLPQDCVRDVADAMLEFAAQEAERYVGLSERAAELRSQKSK